MCSNYVGCVITHNEQPIGVVVDDGDEWLVKLTSGDDYYMRCPIGMWGWAVVNNEETLAEQLGIILTVNKAKADKPVAAGGPETYGLTKSGLALRQMVLSA